MTEKIDWKRNSLNTVRLIAALSVMCFHVIAHMDIPAHPLLLSGISFFSGVPIFFAMSGYLIWNSVGRSGSFKAYAAKRFRRIYPELWCAVAVCILALLPFADEPMQWTDLGIFAVAQGTILQFWTPDSLRFFGCGTPNGSLWTICVMIQFYIAVFFLHRLLAKRKAGAWLAVLTTAIAVSHFSPLLEGLLPTIVYKLYCQTLLPYCWLFLLGALAAQYRDSIVPLCKRFWLPLLAAALAVMLTGLDISMATAGYSLFRCTALFAGLLGAAYRFPGLSVKTDISYGIYLYHMIVVNVMIELNLVGKTGYLLLAMALSCLLAYLSTVVFGKLLSPKKAA